MHFNMVSPAVIAPVRLPKFISDKASVEELFLFSVKEIPRCFKTLFSKVWKHLETGYLRIL